MQFLCLHGYLSNGPSLAMQLAPLEKELGGDQEVIFHYVSGPTEAKVPAELEGIMDQGPYFRWINDDEKGDATNVMNRMRHLPADPSSEELMRAFAGSGTAFLNRQDVLSRLYEMLDSHPEIAGVIGFSEGAAVAATLVLDEERKLRKEGRPRRIRCAMFCNGWPPISPDGQVVLADDSDLIIDIPSLHVIGANDPFRHGARALYNVCDEDTAVLFDTGKGHTIPREGRVVSELADAVRELIETIGQ